MTKSNREVVYAAIVAMMVVALKRETHLGEKHQIVDLAAKLLGPSTPPNQVLSMLEDLKSVVLNEGIAEISSFFWEFANEPLDIKKAILHGAGVMSCLGVEDQKIDFSQAAEIAVHLEISRHHFTAWRDEVKVMHSKRRVVSSAEWMPNWTSSLN